MFRILLNDGYENVQKEIFDDRENKENIEQLIANPIHVYKLIKAMQRFAKDVYHPLLKTSLDKGISIT